MFVGEVVAQVDRLATGERRALQQFQHCAALVHAGGLELQYQVARLQLVAGQVRHRGDRRFVQGRQLRRGAAAMQGYRGLLVFQLHAVEARGQRVCDIAHVRLLRRRDREVPAVAVDVAQLQSVQPGGGPARGVEQAIKIGQLATADQCQRAVEPAVQGVQQLQQCGIRPHRQRVVGKVEQSAVDIEKDRPAGAGVGQRGRRQRVAGCASDSGSGR